MAVKSPNVELHIEEIVLHGFTPVDRRAIAAAIEAELGRLLANEGLPASLVDGTSLGALDAGAFPVAASDRPSAVGGRIGRSLYRSMGSAR